MNGKIFISYRRADAAGHAGRLRDRLASWFDTDSELFFDVESIDSGEDFPRRLIDEIDCAAVVLVLIGPGWLDEINRRASFEEVDFVRREVEQSLQRRVLRQGLRVIPVLMGGAAMPSAAALAEPVRAGLSGLCELDAHVFHHGGKQDDWEHQFVRLRKLIHGVPGAPRERYREHSGQARPWRVVEHALSAHFQDPRGLLSALRGRLQDGGGTAAVVGAGSAKAAALHGMGGIGKTQLALAYCHQYRDAYAGIWWLRAESEGGLGDTLLQQDALAACAVAGVAVPDGVLPSEVFRQWLGRQSAPWLLVFDNADDPRKLGRHLPGPGPHHVIVTSRRPDWGTLAGEVVELTTWTPGQGADFLLLRLGKPEAERTAAEALSEAMGGLPLALEMAASYTEATGCGLSDYLRLWQQAEAELLDDADSVPATGYERTVAATLALAFERLGEPARRLLRLCALAAPEPLPERFLREGREHLPEPLATVADSDFIWNKVVAELRRYALVARQDIPSLDRAWLAGGEAPAGTPMEPALVMHRLMQVVVRYRLGVPVEDMLVLVGVLRQACPDDAQSPVDWPRLAALVAHAVYVNEPNRAGCATEPVKAVQDRTSLLNQVAIFLQFGLALVPQARKRFEQVLATNRRVLGIAHLTTLGSMNNLAETLLAMGDWAEASRMHQQVLGINRRELGEEHHSTLMSMNNLASTFWHQGNFVSARDLEKQALAIRRRTQGEDHPDTLTAMGNLAETLRAQRDLAGARSLQEQVLAGNRRRLGQKHPSTLMSMGNLASTLRAQGDLTGAYSLNKDEFVTCCQVLGKEHPTTLTSKGNLALVLQDQGELSGACSLQEQVLAARRRVLGEEHPATLTSMNNLAITLWRLRECGKAIELMACAVKGRSAILGTEHPDTRQSAKSLDQMRRVAV